MNREFEICVVSIEEAERLAYFDSSISFLQEAFSKHF